MDDITRIGKEFFQLPAEEKEKYAIRDFQGYGQIFVVSEEQKRDWGDLLGLIISPPQSRNLSVWPSVPSEFRYANIAWSIIRTFILQVKRAEFNR
jgi:isopenicillin N synthase-like dioxygenase